MERHAKNDSENCSVLNIIGEILPLAIAWIDLKCIGLTEINITEKQNITKSNTTKPKQFLDHKN